MTRLISLMFFFVAGVVRAETQVIELHSASPESLIPVVQPLLGPQIVWGQADSGFVVSARVDGDTVTLDIDIQDGRVQSGTLRNGALRSSLSGALGSWIELGSSSTRAVRISADEDATYSTRERDKLGYELKVELLP